MNRDGLSQRLARAIKLQSAASKYFQINYYYHHHYYHEIYSLGQNYLSAVQCLHFFFKYTPPGSAPAQCIWSDEQNSTPHILYHETPARFI